MRCSCKEKIKSARSAVEKGYPIKFCTIFHIHVIQAYNLHAQAITNVYMQIRPEWCFITRFSDIVPEGLSRRTRVTHVAVRISEIEDKRLENDVCNVT